MIKKYKLKVDPEVDCFLCSKPGTSFDRTSLQFILDLPLCRHHDEVTKSALAKSDREPGQEG